MKIKSKSTLQNITAILAKEFKSDFRNPYTLGGAGLFLLSSLFVCYITAKRISTPAIWVAMFWIIVLFASFNVVAKSFVNESRSRLLYYFTLISPVHFITAKIIYHSMVMIIMSAIASVVYLSLFEITIADPTLFILSLVFGALGLAITLSLLSTIASKAGNNMTLLAILGLPVLLPLILVCTTLMKNSIDGLDWSIQWKYLFVLIALNLVSFGLSVILFPYLWRE